MEENIRIEISETNRGKKQIIINGKYKFNFSNEKKDNLKVYRCTENRTSNKCKSFIILNDKMEILEYESQHNHLEKEYKASKLIVMHKIKETIRKKYGINMTEFNSIRTLILRSQNKQLPPDITSFEEILEESEYYKIENGDNFMIFKNSNLIIFQSPFQSKLFIQYNEDIFAYGTFYIAPKFSYQVFNSRTYVKKINSFYTTSISILKDKKQSTYEILFKEIKKNASKFSNNIIISPINFHGDIEKGISNAAKKIFPQINIKYCVWHFKRSLEIQKKKQIINFLEFFEYFNINYLNKYHANNWNYYNNIEHITNNASESFNNYLNNLFPKKPTFYKLIIALKKEETLSTDEIKALIECYKNKEEKLICIGCDDDDIVELWYDCLMHLNNIKY
ncbi:hypothetical protein H8356DRAFT_1398299 [Neocallimastix lanati (nom. inval.)]|nr:hypothetical protein H8356DRAFT_1398299 [Neocallimastix sp. JGI-2020a]